MKIQFNPVEGTCNEKRAPDRIATNSAPPGMPARIPPARILLHTRSPSADEFHYFFLPAMWSPATVQAHTAQNPHVPYPHRTALWYPHR